VSTANIFFSLLALATNVALVVLIVLAVTGRSGGGSDLLRRVRGLALPLAAAVATVSTLGSLYYSEVLGLRPCPLCWYQRGAMYPLAVVLIVGLVMRRVAVWRIGLPLSLVGAVIAGYHYLIQHVPTLASTTVCSADFPCTAAEVWQFGFISLAYMALSGFLLIAALLWFGVRRSAGDTPRTVASGRRDAAVGVVGTMAVAAVAAVLAVPAAAPPDPAGGPELAAPQVTGEVLPEAVDPANDPAIGQELPAISGTDYTGTQVEILDDGRPKIVMLLAHWCPHCQEEVPEVQGWLDAEGEPADVDLYSVSTAVQAMQPNFPPQDWLQREGWTVPVIADDEDGTVAQAVGVGGYPFFVFVNADGTVAARHAGRLGVAQLEQAVQRLAETAQAPGSDG